MPTSIGPMPVIEDVLKSQWLFDGAGSYITHAVLGHKVKLHPVS